MTNQHKAATLNQMLRNQNREKILQILALPQAPIILKIEDQNKYTPLFWACSSLPQNMALQIVPLMLQKGADPYKLDSYLQNVLYYICKHGKDRLLKYMLDNYNFDLNTNDMTRQTPLFFAASYGQLKCAQLLIAKGADINHIDNNGQNCLFWSASNGYLDMCKYLVKQGVNFNKVDGNKQTALSYAKKKKHLPIIAYLQDLKSTIKKTVKQPQIMKEKFSKISGVQQSSQQQDSKNQGARKKKQLSRQPYCLIYTNEKGQVHELTVQQLQKFASSNQNNKRVFDLIRYPDRLQNHPIPEQKKYQKVANKILTHFMKHQQGFHFLYPVDTAALNIPHYPNIVKHPMDFTTIKTKLSYNAYDNQLDFHADMNLVFDNCILFNTKESSYGKIATQMKLQFNAMYKKQFGG